jgi:hypothetical protein
MHRKNIIGSGDGIHSAGIPHYISEMLLVFFVRLFCYCCCTCHHYHHHHHWLLFLLVLLVSESEICMQYDELHW